jgi:catechol 2,3-dioxygenase-like lactoylglutathione lyase family enzyme
MHPQPLIAVHDVAASNAWYQQLLGCRSAHGGREYDQLVDDDGKLVLQLHAWETHEHPHMGDPSLATRSNGVLLWFQIVDFDAAVARARTMRATICEGPMINPSAHHRELWLRDLDG